MTLDLSDVKTLHMSDERVFHENILIKVRIRNQINDQYRFTKAQCCATLYACASIGIGGVS